MLGLAPGYQAKAGSRLSGDAVQRLGAAVDKLNRGAGATPEALVELARDPASAIHQDFEWDDEAAALKYRLQQARYYLRSIVVEWVTEEGEALQVRAFNPVYTDGTGDVRWSSMRDVVERDGEVQVLLARAQDELRAFRKKYKGLRVVAEAVKMMQTIDGFVDDDD